MSGDMWEPKPGDVAVVCNADSGLNGLLAMRAAADDERPEAWVVGEKSWLSMAFASRELRRVVVIDPEDREQVRAFTTDYDAAVIRMNSDPDPRVVTPEQRVTAMQAALRSLLAPPKPDEPTGLGAVVEDSEGTRWVRVQDEYARPWFIPGGISTATWDDLTAVRVLSEGVTP